VNCRELIGFRAKWLLALGQPRTQHAVFPGCVLSGCRFHRLLGSVRREYGEICDLPALAGIKGLPVSGINESADVCLEFLGYFWGKDSVSGIAWRFCTDVLVSAQPL
jgi:hypothetical protein